MDYYLKVPIKHAKILEELKNIINKFVLFTININKKQYE